MAKKEILLAQLDEEINALRLDYSRLELNLKDSRALFAETERIKIKLETEMTSQQARGEETKQRLADAWEISVEEAEKKANQASKDWEGGSGEAMARNSAYTEVWSKRCRALLEDVKKYAVNKGKPSKACK